MAPKSSFNQFRIIIAGGGLAGLTLANALERAGIDYLLLEARDVIDPAVGASMGFFPSGARILDQLDCFDDILKLTYAIKMAGNHRKSGKLIHPRGDGSQLTSARTGYDSVFLDRQLVLQVLYNHVKDKSKILTGKSLSKVDHTPQGVTVYCEDGTSYTGDIIAGADGVYSKVRQQMWDVADREEPGFITDSEKQSLSAEYQILYGISTATPGMLKGNYDITYSKDISFMNIVGEDDMVYWFLFKKLDRVYKYNEIPRYTKAEAQAFAETHLNINIDDDPKVQFGDIWKNRKYFSLHATEEADYKHWTWGRFACLGDSVHKTTPNAGIGGNAALESAAALANSLKILLDSSPSQPSFEEVKQTLARFEKSRHERSSELLKVSNGVTRTQALKTLMDRFVVFCIFPNAGDILTDMFSEMLIGATKIDYLPPPTRSLRGTMPFNPEQGTSKKESIGHRILLTIPFFVLSALSRHYMNSGTGLNELGGILTAGRITWGENIFAITENFYHVAWLDNKFKPMTVIFASPSFGIDPVGWWQMLSFITDLGVLYAIFLIEATRRCNNLTFAQFPFLFGWAAHFYGIGVIAPLYFALHYTSSQIANFKALDMRLTNLAYTRTVLPVLAIANYIPHFISFTYPDLTVRHYADWIWQLYPLWVSLLQFLLAKTIMPDTIQNDRVHAPLRDLPTIRYTVGTFIGLSSLIWLYTLTNSPFSLLTIFLPFGDKNASWVDCVRIVLQFDHIFCWASALLWLGYLFADLKHAGMVGQSWVKIVGAGGVSLIALGPGATVGLGWLWREDVIAHKKHKGAVVKGWEAANGGDGSVKNGGA